ncbi:hypothetical protein RF11_05925 [Thelohanellus kitauei]|uniref:Reverse transcriptase domain-containing protein n=1 Tax=Thelohanellus kitauei TaxID=669202 RepID=A0A0C2N0B8_THEKT|nr:hypothetical protein RF11_05925 [Thelohanellus kitauei]
MKLDFSNANSLFRGLPHLLMDEVVELNQLLKNEAWGVQTSPGVCLKPTQILRQPHSAKTKLYPRITNHKVNVWYRCVCSSDMIYGRRPSFQHWMSTGPASDRISHALQIGTSPTARVKIKPRILLPGIDLWLRNNGRGAGIVNSTAKRTAVTIRRRSWNFYREAFKNLRETAIMELWLPIWSPEDQDQQESHIKREVILHFFGNNYDRSRRANLKKKVAAFLSRFLWKPDTAPSSLFKRRTEIVDEKLGFHHHRFFAHHLYKCRLQGYINVGSESHWIGGYGKGNHSSGLADTVCNPSRMTKVPHNSLNMIYVDLQNAFDRIPHALMQHLIIHIYFEIYCLTGRRAMTVAFKLDDQPKLAMVLQILPLRCDRPEQSRFNHVAYMDNIKIWISTHDLIPKIRAVIEALTSFEKAFVGCRLHI